jgi:fimbrial isopeptide formation D2 family protein
MRNYHSIQKSIATLMVCIATISMDAQAAPEILDFRNPTIINGGADLAVGTQYRFQNVGMDTNGVAVDALVTIAAKSANSTLIQFDDNAEPFTAGVSDFRPVVQNSLTTPIGDPDGDYVEFFFEFVLNSDNTQAVIVETNAYSMDVDGNNDDLREYVVITNFGSYTLENPTELIFIPPARFESSTDLVNDGINANSAWLAKTDYAAITTFTYRAGVLRDGTAVVLDRLFALAFEPLSFTTPVVTFFAPTITKTNDDADAGVMPGDMFSYTVTIDNPITGQTLTAVTIDDALPAGVTYVPGSSSTTYPVTATVSGSFTRALGAVSFDGSGASQTHTVTAADVPSSATLTNFAYSVSGNSTDWLSEISLNITYPGTPGVPIANSFGGNGPGNFIPNPTTFSAAASGPAEGTYTFIWADSFDFGGLANNVTASSFTINYNSTTSTATTNPAGTPPNLITSTLPEASGITLAPGDSMTVTYQVTVDAGATSTIITNTASFNSPELNTPITDTSSLQFVPTAATIGEINLNAISVNELLAQLGIDELSDLELLELLRAWDANAAAALTGGIRSDIVSALEKYLDPDEDDKVAVLRWDTLEERGTIGFYVDRRVDEGAWQRINNDLLPGLISAPMGGEYLLADPKAHPTQANRYRLIELEATGTTRTYGPYLLKLQ